MTYDPVATGCGSTLTARNQVVGIDLAGGTPRVTTRIPTVRQPNTIAVDDTTGELFVTGTDTGVLELIPPSLIPNSQNVQAPELFRTDLDALRHAFADVGTGRGRNARRNRLTGRGQSGGCAAQLQS